LQDFIEVIEGKATTPAAEYLFTVRDESKARLLDKEKAPAFNHTVSQLLFMSSHARQDIQTTVALLTTRVKSPDKDDWGKLK
jgi:hypothetical protein